MKRRLPDILLAMMVAASLFLILLTAASYVRTLSVTRHWAKPGIPTAEGTLVDQYQTLAAARGWAVWLWNGTQAVGDARGVPAAPNVATRSEVSEYDWAMGDPVWPRPGEHGFLLFDYSNDHWLNRTITSNLRAPVLRTSDFRLRVSLWAICLPFVAATLWLWTLRRRRRRAFRRAHHLCESCGYDLRATPDRCPECGVAAQNSKDLLARAHPIRYTHECEIQRK